MCKGNGHNGHIQPEVKETHVRNTVGRCEIFGCELLTVIFCKVAVLTRGRSSHTDYKTRLKMPKKNKGKKSQDDDWNDPESEGKLSAQMEDLATGDTENEEKKKKKKVIE